MSLFDITEKRQEEKTDTSFFRETNAASEYFNAASIKQFKIYLSKLEHNRNYHFSTGGQWSMHELMIYLLSITGPADIWKSTWAISEEPVRVIIELLDKKIIRSVKCIFDYKVKEQKSKAFLLAQSNFNSVTLAHCHAKVMVIKNENWSVSVSGSANDTRNPRIERGVICTVPEIAEEDIRWIEAVIKGEKIFKVRK
jgi:hypothetical protein